MKIPVKLLLIIFLLVTVINVNAQDTRGLVKEGIQLSNEGKYQEAIEKYNAALKLDPDNPSANYQTAFALNAAGKGEEGLPYLQKVLQSNASSTAKSGAYELMGTIYDQSHQPQKAIESYLQGINADSASYSLRYNLALVYFRNKQYPEAEKRAVEALTINPNHAASIRLFALVTFHQDNRAAAFLGFCRFLWLEPKGPKSLEAYGNIQHILQGGVLKVESGTQPPHPDANIIALNKAITGAVTATSKRRYMTSGDLFSDQLQLIFKTVGQMAQKQGGSDFFHSKLAPFFYQMSQTANVPAFARIITQGTDHTATAWLNAHQQQVTAFSDWANSNKLLK